uniref:G8 domain-containing protein n=1 Tax=Chromera velia CCMP2878 TaxID=1169474 RepID=A0A0G4G4X5_9ALVE|eukprot:Cvel_4177.t1-p1 / transcript=Cvel_4177.t1 / gene=Cvel_4177 / organism=Chromera_velia_CCMP2878 / gene_product=G8 domain-containing protein DDB_G0286897, putative / transcript_product=G8 domain-containing protein DDB_G0286897, putative / location=Cvel_scaffold180:30015-36095(+) / protein_length=1509 / sequence_SO=supercontig / SO=protein_coding / is_pseudo=false
MNRARCSSDSRSGVVLLLLVALLLHPASAQSGQRLWQSCNLGQPCEQTKCFAQHTRGPYPLCIPESECNGCMSAEDYRALVPSKQVNVAVMKPAVASSQHSSDYDASNAVDGKEDWLIHRWVSGNVLPHTLEIDFGSPYEISSFRLMGGLKTASGFERVITEFTIDAYDQLSDSWTMIYGALGNTQSDLTASFPKTLTGKVRLSVTAVDSDTVARVYEFEVFGVKPATWDRMTNVAMGKPASADSAFTGYAPEKAVDGVDTRYEDRWVSLAGNQGVHWLEIDLQGSFALLGANLKAGLPPSSPLDSFVIEGFDESKMEWVPLHFPVTGNKEIFWYKDFRGDPKREVLSASRVRLSILYTGPSDFFARVYEFRVFGIPAGEWVPPLSVQMWEACRQTEECKPIVCETRDFQSGQCRPELDCDDGSCADLFRPPSEGSTGFNPLPPPALPPPETPCPLSPPSASDFTPMPPPVSMPPLLPLTYVPTPLIPSPLVANEVVHLSRPPVPSPPPANPVCPWHAPGLKIWHDAATWPSGIVPQPDGTSEITLPPNTHVLVLGCSLPPPSAGFFKKIIIPSSSSLVFADEPIHLRVSDIEVMQGGALVIGSEECRTSADISISFVGSKSDTSIKKQLLSHQGSSVDIHGRRFFPTWSRLAAPVEAGDWGVLLQEPVDWLPGQQVVVVTSEYRDEITQQNEIRSIRTVSEGGKFLELDKPLQFPHYAGMEYQVEVGLLSRTVRIQGEEADSEYDEFGGDIRIEGIGRLSGVQLARMGKKNMLGRYPAHFHFAGDRNYDSYFRDMSCYHTYFRCLVVHSTNSTYVEENVAFDVTGHAYYLEAGDEENNIFRWNLGAFVHTVGRPAQGPGQEGEIFTESPYLIQPDDSAASVFYFANPYQIIEGNAASGGWAGYSIPKLNRPVRAPDNGMEPAKRPFKSFQGNSAHSAGYMWHLAGCMYIGGELYIRQDGLLEYNSGRGDSSRDTKDPQGQFDDFISLKNSSFFLCNRAVQHWGSRMEVEQFEMHDTELMGQAFGEGWFGKGVVNGFSGNTHVTGRNPPGGFEWYDTHTQALLTDVTFRNFPSGQTSKIFQTLTHADEFKPQVINGLSGIVLEPTVAESEVFGNRRRPTGAFRYFSVVDRNHWQGGGEVIIGSFSALPSEDGLGDWWVMHENCEVRDPVQNVIFCDRQGPGGEMFDAAHIGIEIPGLISGTGGESWRDDVVGRTTLFGDSMSVSQGKERWASLTRNRGVTGPVSEHLGWFLTVDNGAPKRIDLSIGQLPRNGHLILATPFPKGTTFTLTRSLRWSDENFSGVKVNSLQAAVDGSGAEYFFDESGTSDFGILYVKVRAPYWGDWARGGASIPKLMTRYDYEINAVCPEGTDTENFCTLPSGSNVMPTTALPSLSPAGEARKDPPIDNYDFCNGDRQCQETRCYRYNQWWSACLVKDTCDSSKHECVDVTDDTAPSCEDNPEGCQRLWGNCHTDRRCMPLLCYEEDRYGGSCRQMGDCPDDWRCNVIPFEG